MNDTISRQAAIDAVCKAGCGSGFCGVECDEVLALRNMSSAQPEIVRCNDCKWHLAYRDPKYNVGYELCGNPKMMIGDQMIGMSSADFCSNAETQPYKEGGAV